MWGRTYPHKVLLIFASIILKASCNEIGSLTFLIDETTSMGNNMRQVKSTVNRILDTVFDNQSRKVNNTVLVTFNDPTATLRAVTEDRQTFKKALDEVRAHSTIRNMDCWEPSMNGLLLALETSNNNSYIYVFTDAPAKDYRDSHKVINMCQEKQTQIVFVLTGRCKGSNYGPEPYDVYYDIAQACASQMIDVQKNEVEQVFRKELTTKSTLITSTTLPAGIRKEISPKATVLTVGKTNFAFTLGFSEQKPESLDETSTVPIADSNVRLSISITDAQDSVQVVSAQILDLNEEPVKDPLPLTETSKNLYVTDLFVAPSQSFKVAVNGIIKATGQPIKRVNEFPVEPHALTKESTYEVPGILSKVFWL